MINFGCEKWWLNKNVFSRLAPGAFRYCLGRELFHYAICISLDLPNVIHLVLDLQLSLKNAGRQITHICVEHSFFFFVVVIVSISAPPQRLP